MAGQSRFYNLWEVKLILQGELDKREGIPGVDVIREGDEAGEVYLSSTEKVRFEIYTVNKSSNI